MGHKERIFAFFHPVLQGCQHAVGLYRGFHPLPSGADVSVSYRALAHYRRFGFSRHRSSASTFLAPFAPRPLRRFIARMEPLTPGAVTSAAGSPSFSRRAFPPFCRQPPRGPRHRFYSPSRLCQRGGLPAPCQVTRFGPWGLGRSGLRHSLADSSKSQGRIAFVILRTGGSPPVASHPALRQRSYVRFQAGDVCLEGTCTPRTLRLRRRTRVHSMHRRASTDSAKS